MKELLWRLCESPKDYRYGGLRAALRWIFKGVSRCRRLTARVPLLSL